MFNKESHSSDLMRTGEEEEENPRQRTTRHLANELTFLSIVLWGYLKSAQNPTMADICPNITHLFVSVTTVAGFCRLYILSIITTVLL